MTEIRQEAMKILENIPEEHIDQAVDMLKKFYDETRPLTDEEKELRRQRKKKAFDRIMEIVRSNKTRVPADFDYKKEYLEWIDEKYGTSN